MTLHPMTEELNVWLTENYHTNENVPEDLNIVSMHFKIVFFLTNLQKFNIFLLKSSKYIQDAITIVNRHVNNCKNA